MKRYIYTIFCALLSHQALSVDLKGGSAESIGTELPVQLRLTKAFCQKLILEHKAQKNVMYQAGVDQEGERVVPVDLNAFKVPLPTKIRIPVTLKKQFDIQAQPPQELPEESPAEESPDRANTEVAEGGQEGTVHSETGVLVPSGTIKSPYVDEIPFGFVEYELESGEITYNGKKFSSKEEALLRQKCRTILEN